MYKVLLMGPLHAADFIKYSLFLLFALVALYTVTANTDLANTELLLLMEMQGSVPTSLWSQHFYQLINTNHMCVSV